MSVITETHFKNRICKRLGDDHKYRALAVFRKYGEEYCFFVYKIVEDLIDEQLIGSVLTKLEKNNDYSLEFFQKMYDELNLGELLY